MNTQSCWNIFCGSFAAFGILFVASCERQSTTAKKLSPFSVTNEVVDGELRQVLEMTNGISFYFTKSNAVMWFCKESDIVIKFDPKTQRPLSILLETPASADRPGQLIYDLNADGVPDVGELKDTSRTQQIFYRGEWYAREKEGTHSVITIDGKKQRVHFNGQRWIDESTNSDMEITNALLTNRF